MSRSFYKAPVVKSLLVLTTATSLLHGARHRPPLLASDALHGAGDVLLATCAVASLGQWLATVLLMFHCRRLEQLRGSSTFTRWLLSSTLLACALLALSAYLLQGPLHATGLLVNVVVGSLTVQCLLSLPALYSLTVCGVTVSSNVPYYLLSLVLCLASLSSLLAAVCGWLAALLTALTGPLPLSFSPWLTTPLAKVVAVETPPPIQFSGATLSVQRQQRTDHLERVLMNLQQTRQQQPPPEALVRQLEGMGFPRAAAEAALASSGGDLTAAVRMLTARNT